jgi:hypothetical protein
VPKVSHAPARAAEFPWNQQRSKVTVVVFMSNAPPNDPPTLFSKRQFVKVAPACRM